MSTDATLLFKRILVALLGALVILSLPACGEEPPLKIGFVGGVTGRVADLGVAGRDAVLLAVEEQNLAGGINGRKIELIVKDDQQDANIAEQVVHELLAERVDAIVGPMTSSMAVKLQPLVNASQTVMISPTAKTDQLSGQDDFFLRVTAPLSENARAMAANAVNDRRLKRFAVAYDKSNKAFTETWLNYFREALSREGGEVVFAEGFDSQQNTRFLPLAERLLAEDVDGILFLSNAIDTALMTQQIRKLGSDVSLFCTEWAFTVDLISFGGRSVEGMTSFHSFNVNSQDHAYLLFKEKFVNRFGYTPSFATALAYDAATFLFLGLKKQPSSEHLKKALLELQTFSGLQSPITVDPFGDVKRKLFMTVIEDGQFKVIQ